MTPEQLAASNTETAHQRALFAAINGYCFALEKSNDKEPLRTQLQLLFAIPNGGQRHKAVASGLKAEGVKSGVWDLFLPVQRRFIDDKKGVHWHYAGLWIEMKAPDRRNDKDGGLSEEQVKFGYAMQAQGYDCHVCYTWSEALKTILDYLI